jgi:predicted ATPase
MPENFPTDRPYVFVSYASRDRPRVLEMVNDLRASGIQAWIDLDDITGGASYGPEIAAGVKGAGALLLMCSDASLASRNVRQEIQLAWRYERPIVPLLLEAVTFPDDLIYWLEGTQWIETFGNQRDAWIARARQALSMHGYPISASLSGTTGADPAPIPVELPPNNLPVYMSPILGRDRELRRLLALVNNGRLITVTGTGGVGKTRLALEIARRLAPAYPGGTWIVDASADRSAADLAQSTASAIGVAEQAGESVQESLLRHLRDAESLLVLDNLEQIRDAADLLSRLVEEAPNLKIIATSRAPIRSAAEMVFPLGGFEISAETGGTAVDVAQQPAVALFVDRARQSRPDFALTVGNFRDVLAICARLDGLPLAIELAAARVRLLPPAAILDRLDESLSLLTRAGQAVIDRQRTLRSTIAWSYELLEPDGQRAFERLSVFAGGCPVEAAEAVLENPSGLDLIDGLIEQHLLQAEAGQQEQPRVRMLETIREFALEQLRARGDEPVARQRHAEWFRDLAKSSFVQLEEGTNPELLDRLEKERANLREAISCFAGFPDGSFGDLEIADALFRFWWMRGHLEEGLTSLSDAVTRNPGAPVQLRASAMISAAVIAETRGDLTRAARLLDEAICMVEGTDHRTIMARAHSGQGNIAEISGDLELASDCFERSLAIYRELGHERGVAVTLHQLSSVLVARGEYHRAEPLVVQALEVWRKRGEMQSLAYTLQQLGIVTFYQENYERAAELYQETVAIAESLGDLLGQGNALLNWGSALEMSGDLEGSLEKLQRSRALFVSIEDAGGIGQIDYQIGRVFRSKGKIADARDRLTDALDRLSTVGDLSTMALVFETLAGLVVDSGRPELATRLFGAAESLREQTGAVIPSTRVDEVLTDRTAAATLLGESQFATEIERGRTSDLAQIIADLGSWRQPLIERPEPTS